MDTNDLCFIQQGSECNYIVELPPSPTSRKRLYCILFMFRGIFCLVFYLINLFIISRKSSNLLVFSEVMIVGVYWMLLHGMELSHLQKQTDT